MKSILQKSSKSARLLGASALLLVLLAIVAFRPSSPKASIVSPAPVTDTKTDVQSSVPKLKLLVTKRDIKKGELLTEQLLAARSVDENLVPASYVELRNADSLLNKVTNKPIKSRTIITPSDVDDLPPTKRENKVAARRELTLEINPNAIDRACGRDFANKRFEIYWRIKTASQIVSLLLAHSAQITSSETSKCHVPPSVLANAEVFDPPPCIGLSMSVDESAAEILTVAQKQNMVGRYPSFQMTCHPVSEQHRWEDVKTLSMNEVKNWIGDIPFFKK